VAGDGGAVLLAAVIDMAPGRVEQGRAYEDAVLGLLGRHDGLLERRLRTRDGGAEVHVIRFASRAAYQGFPAWPGAGDGALPVPPEQGGPYRWGDTRARGIAACSHYW
jgi:hypothetical protein